MKTLNLDPRMKSPALLFPLPHRSGRVTIPMAVLFGLAWIAWPGAAPAQPNYTSETEVAGYVKGMLYWPSNNAAFAYKSLLYIKELNRVLPEFTNMATLYGADQRNRAAAAQVHLERGLTNNPTSTVLGELLLDLHYDRAAAEAILAQDAIEKAERAHFGPPIAPSPASGFIIDNEIAAYTNALPLNRSALASYCTLLTNTLGVADGNPTPLGYRIFQERVPERGLTPATYLSNNVPVSVTADTNAFLAGYKDLVLLYELLRDQGRTAATLARLRFLRNGPGDASQAETLITDTERSLFLHAQLLRTAFPALDANDASLANSGLAAAMASVSDALEQLESLRQLRRSQLNPLGLEKDFLVLVQGAFSGETNQNDTYNALLVHLGHEHSVLGRATAALETARSSYSTYRGYEDQLAEQYTSSCITYYDRLRDIVGFFPYEPAYAASPQGAPGSELDQQNLSIEAARLQIRKNQAEIYNLQQQANFELQKAADISNVYIVYGDKQAAITEWIGLINGAQAAANELANAAESAGDLNLAGTAGHGANAVFQYAAEIGKGVLEAQKERLAAAQNAEITGIEARTTVKVLLLQMNTLAVDSLAAALQLRKEINRLQDLYREKAQLERSLQEKDQGLGQRFFADPIHRLTLQADMLEADQMFQQAQTWLFFMARALEYKWNEPFVNGAWTLESLFKLRNAGELWNLYLAMKDFDDGRTVFSVVDDRWDWLSLREDLLGFRRFGNHGEVLTYVDPVTGEQNVDALTLFRRHLQRQQDANGVIHLEFDTVRQNHNTFFRGSDDLLGIPGQYLDKIDSMVIRLPGQHTTTNYTQWDTLSGALGYGGSAYVRNRVPGTSAAGHPDRLVNEMTAYTTKWWYQTPAGQWRYRDIRTNSVSMLKANPNAPRDSYDFPSDIPARLATHALIINTFRERSVAASRWILRIPTWHPTIQGIQTLRIEELDDIEIYFYHWSKMQP